MPGSFLELSHSCSLQAANKKIPWTLFCDSSLKLQRMLFWGRGLCESNFESWLVVEEDRIQLYGSYEFRIKDEGHSSSREISIYEVGTCSRERAGG